MGNAALLDRIQPKIDEDSPKTNTQNQASTVSFATARQNHRQNLQTLQGMIKTGQKENNTRFGIAWPNACEWLDSGLTSLHALTETHDSSSRATANGKVGKKAMFGIDTKVPNDSGYQEKDLKDQSNIYFANPSWLGFRSSGNPSKVIIINPSQKSKDSVQETIVHEVQHDSDKHDHDAFSRYSTEFRAYWIDGTYRSKSPTSGSAKTTKANDGTEITGFDNERQLTIFLHLYNSTSYSYVKNSWSDSDFQEKVWSMKMAEGVNTINSVRINAMYEAVDGLGTDEDAFFSNAAKLTEEEKEHIRSPAMRKIWTELIYGDFSGVQLEIALRLVGLK